MYLYNIIINYYYIIMAMDIHWVSTRIKKSVFVCVKRQSPSLCWSTCLQPVFITDCVNFHHAGVYNYTVVQQRKPIYNSYVYILYMYLRHIVSLFVVVLRTFFCNFHKC